MISISTDLRGCISALISCVAFGSYGVLVKGKDATKVDIDPLVMQSYKTLMIIVFAILIIAFGEELTFTPYGILSALFWVPGGTAGMFAIRNAGLAVSQGLWSTCKVLVAFVWGICIFREQVKSPHLAVFSIVIILVGIWGMSYFSSKNTQQRELEIDHEQGSLNSDVPSVEVTDYVSMKDEGQEEDQTPFLPLEEIPSQREGTEEESKNPVSVFGFALKRRKVGIMCALFDGIWGGNILVPMHYARDTAEGLGFVFSFAVGAGIVLTFLWIIRFLYSYQKVNSFVGAYMAMPSFHVKQMWCSGMVAGSLWSIGHISSIFAVTYLGEGIGYSITQAQLIIAGLWGVFLYKEVRGRLSILKWFGSAGVTLFGVYLLSEQHD